MLEQIVGFRCRTLAAWLVVSVVACCSFAPSTRADEASGTWTGEIEGHGSYYVERSTKVLVPTGRLSLEAPNGIRAGVSYLADVITSASLASGRDVDAAHVEVRQGIGGNVGKTFALGDNELDVGANVIRSWESDYLSWIYGGRVGFLFNQKNTGVSLGVTGVSDKVYANQPDGGRLHSGDLDGVTLNFGFSQILSPVLILGGSYQLVYLTGFLGNPYRAAKLGPLRYAEKPPDTRVRHNLEVSLSWFLPPTGTTVQGFARVYTDSWDVYALTPELRIYQALGRSFSLRVRLRYYLQSSAYFASDNVGVYPGIQTYYTQDPKLTAFHSYQTGLRLSYSLQAFDRSIFAFVSRGSLDLSFDYQWTSIRSTSFGKENAFVILGGRLPF